MHTQFVARWTRPNGFHFDVAERHFLRAEDALEAIDKPFPDGIVEAYVVLVAPGQKTPVLALRRRGKSIVIRA